MRRALLSNATTSIVEACIKSCPITPIIRPLTYKVMALHPDVKAMALYPNECFSVTKVKTIVQNIYLYEAVNQQKRYS